MQKAETASTALTSNRLHKATKTKPHQSPGPQSWGFSLSTLAPSPPHKNPDSEPPRRESGEQPPNRPTANPFRNAHSSENA
jgi:hypothetical protein